MRGNRLLLGLLVGMGALGVAGEGGAHDRGDRRSRPHRAPAASFRRIATLPNYLNNADIAEETVSEIVASTKDGSTLLYTDSPLDEVGLVDIRDPYRPVGLGKVRLGGEPTSVAVLGNRLALVGVNTSESFVTPGGYLAVVDIATQSVVAEVPLGGQPDSVAISPDGSFAAIAVENERDEDMVVRGAEGGLPQGPAGFLAVVDLAPASPLDWAATSVNLTGLANYAPGDPEPEFVDINTKNQAVVTLQENNHLAVVDLPSARVVRHFSAGAVTLEGVDGTEDGIISLTETLPDVPREPDAVTWIGSRFLATANEGDLFGGSRGFSIFDRRGNVVFDSGSSLEELAVQHGHFPEGRADAKGTEPEAVEHGRFGASDYLFVGSERGGFVAVYEVDRRGRPAFVQLLPAPLRPEGVHAIPSRNLLVVSGEKDDPSFGVRSSMMIYELSPGGPAYPEIVSTSDASGAPIPWSALSGMTTAPGRKRELLAVWDSFYAESRVVTIDASRSPALITDSVALSGGSGDYDAEGIAIAPDGTWWIASEGNETGSRRNRLLHVDPSGAVLEEVGLPEAIEACRAASTNTATLGSGFEGVAVARRGRGRGYDLIVAQQRGWDYTTEECEDLDDDPDQLDAGEPKQTRLWRYDPATGAWTSTPYELEPVPPDASWVGLSEITTVPGGFVVIERDNRTGDFSQLKTLAKFSWWELSGGVSRGEKKVFDLMPALLSSHGWISDKAEGVAMTRDGSVFVVTDNDGVDDWSGETRFLSLGSYFELFH